MAKELSKSNLSVFEQIKHIDENGNEFWMARQLSKILDYTDFRNFSGVIDKAIEACKKSGQNPEEHLVEANEVLIAGNGAKQTHYEVGAKVCQTIKEIGGTMPENLPVADSIKTVQKKISNSEKKNKD